MSTKHNRTRPLVLVAALAAVAALSLTGLVADGATYVAQFVYGIRYDKQASKPSNCPEGRVCDWVDTSGRKHFWNGTADTTTPNVAATAKGDIAAYTGTAWAKLAVGTNGQCLKADSTETTGLEWAACGGGGGYDTIENNGTPLTQRTTLHCDGTLVVCSDDAGNSETDITLGSTVVTESSTDTLTNKTLTSPVLSGTATGTYTLGGTPTLGADTTLSAGVDINGSSTSDITMRSFKPSSAAPSISAGAFLGTSPSGLALSTGSNAHAGEITWTQGTSSPTSGDYFTVTPPITASNGWSVLFFPCNDNLALKWLQFSNGLALKIVSTTTTWTLNVVSETALADGATYCMRYLAFPY
jgi:hypothetical protein